MVAGAPSCTLGNPGSQRLFGAGRRPRFTGVCCGPRVGRRATYGGSQYARGRGTLRTFHGARVVVQLARQ
eukprot:11191474-Lingulodinium_polyedra.AAC.1